MLKRAWVIGPVFYQDVPLRGIEQGLQYYNRMETSVAWTMPLYEVLKPVPVLQCTVLHRYALIDVYKRQRPRNPPAFVSRIFPWSYAR